MDGVKLLLGDCREVMAELPECSVDAIVTDPPYDLTAGKKGGSVDASVNLDSPYGRSRITTGFMGKRWDGTGVAFEAATWAEALRVLKPGGHLLAFGAPRTYHRLTCAIEDAGFEIRDSLMWLAGSGFPKSLQPYRSIMKPCQLNEHAKPAVVLSPLHQVALHEVRGGSAPALVEILPEGEVGLLIPTGAADGSGEAMVIGPSALKAAGMSLNIEPSWRSTWGESSETANTYITAMAIKAITAWKTSNYSRSLPMPPITILDEQSLDGCRCSAFPVVEVSSDNVLGWSDTRIHIAPESVTGPRAGLRQLGTSLKPAYEPVVMARKPLIGTVAANVAAYGTGGLNIDGCRIEGVKPVMERTATVVAATAMAGPSTGARSTGEMSVSGRWPANVMLDEAAAVLLDAQAPATGAFAPVRGTEPTADGFSGPIYGTQKGRQAATFYADAGGASRFFYTAKTSRAEREYGLGDLEAARRSDGRDKDIENPRLRTNARRNDHPTVKPVDLMRWLCRLVTPPGGTILDPFVGSGSTGMAALDEGFSFIGIDLEAHYLDIARRRIERRHLIESMPQPPTDVEGQRPLF